MAHSFTVLCEKCGSDDTEVTSTPGMMRCNELDCRAYFEVGDDDPPPTRRSKRRRYDDDDE